MLISKETFKENLKDLILGIFSADEFRQFIRYSPNGELLEKSLPGKEASFLKHVSDGIEILWELDGIDNNFFKRLIEKRPKRKDEIEKIKIMWMMTE